MKYLSALLCLSVVAIVAAGNGNILTLIGVCGMSLLYLLSGHKENNFSRWITSTQYLWIKKTLSFLHDKRTQI